MNVILLASSAPQVGKSSLARTLVQMLEGCRTMAFAYPIKEISYNLYKDVMQQFDKDVEVSFQDYCQGKKEIPLTDIFSSTPRHQYCDISLLLSNLTSDTIWGDLAAYRLFRFSALDVNTVIIDDWRRPVELQVLQQNKDLNIITIYLDKEDVVQYKGTEATEAFEGKISKEDCDISFTYAKDWSNSQELLDLIINYVEHSTHG